MISKILVPCLILLSVRLCNSSWQSPSSGQYHIQTDEGPERFFRYQTDSGQYRKERRLEDGTVIGTDAWIDALGFLRQKDYIADNQGFRILNSKTVYVGVGEQIERAIKLAKGLPKADEESIHSTTPLRKYATPNNKIPPNSIATEESLPSTVGSKIPALVNQRTINDYHTSHKYRPIKIVTENPLRTVPIINDQIIYNTPPSSTPSPLHIPITPLPAISSNLPDGISAHVGSISGNQIDNSRNKYYHSANNNKIDVSEPHYTPQSQPNYRRYQQSSENHNTVSKYSTIDDDVIVGDNGFRYYLPRKYHEEKTIDNNNRIGSFGYIDPFGIRRVIYYNASPEKGFVIRKNNRYVGFNDTPYDRHRPL